MSKYNTENRTVPRGSLVFVTGVNGLVASNVADQLMYAGYRVRGSVRNRAKTAWMDTVMACRHGDGRFERIEVPDVTAPRAWDEALQGVSGVTHVLGALDDRNSDSDGAAQAEIPWQIALLEACNRQLGVSSFVFTSSVWAATTPDATKKTRLDEWSWNEAAVELVRSDKALVERGFLTPWMALKVLVEQAVWRWVEQQRAHNRLQFTFNSVLLDTVIGYSPHPKEIGIPSTSGMVQWAYSGKNLHLLALMQPQWYVDSRDAAMIYVAALSTPGVDGERLYACGGRYSW